jgi:hypothetical protein
VVSVANSIQAFSTLHYTQQVYLGPKSPPVAQTKAQAPPSGNPLAPYSPVTPLSGRTFGTWTFLSSVIRLYAAYNVDNPVVYQLAYWTYAIAFGHFVSEWLIFGTARWSKGLAGPVIVATGTLIWMTLQWGFYVK